MTEFLVTFIVCYISAIWWEASRLAKEKVDGSESVREGAAKLVFFAFALIVAFLVAILL